MKLVQIGNFIFDLDKFESAHYSKFSNSLHIKIDKEEYMFVYEEAEEMFNQLKGLTINGYQTLFNELKELTKNENE